MWVESRSSGEFEAAPRPIPVRSPTDRHRREHGEVVDAAGQHAIEWRSAVEALPHERKIVIAGNHDFLFEENPSAAIRCLGSGVDYLFDSGLEIDVISFWGSPWTPWFHDWVFNVQRGDALRDKWSRIPDHVDVLVTHGPPHSILDRNEYKSDEGDEALRERVFEVEPALHAFGHIHESSGIDRVAETLFVNAAILDERYRIANSCRVVDLTRSADGSLKAVYDRRISGRDAIRSLERHGYSVARIHRGDMVSVEIDERLIWLDTGYTVRVRRVI